MCNWICRQRIITGITRMTSCLIMSANRLNFLQFRISSQHQHWSKEFYGLTTLIGWTKLTIFPVFLTKARIIQCIWELAIVTLLVQIGLMSDFTKNLKIPALVEGIIGSYHVVSHLGYQPSPEITKINSMALPLKMESCNGKQTSLNLSQSSTRTCCNKN